MRKLLFILLIALCACSQDTGCWMLQVEGRNYFYYQGQFVHSDPLCPQIIYKCGWTMQQAMDSMQSRFSTDTLWYNEPVTVGCLQYDSIMAIAIRTCKLFDANY